MENSKKHRAQVTRLLTLLRIKQRQANKLDHRENADQSDIAIISTVALGLAMYDRIMPDAEPLDRAMSILTSMTEAQAHIMQHYLEEEHNIKVSFAISYNAIVTQKKQE